MILKKIVKHYPKLYNGIQLQLALTITKMRKAIAKRIVV